MTTRAYIVDKLQAFAITEAQLVDVQLGSGLDLEADVTAQDPAAVGNALAQALEELVLLPRKTNVSEGGFSMSWEFDNASKYYVWLCRKWNITPNAAVLTLLGLSTITDLTSHW